MLGWVGWEVGWVVDLGFVGCMVGLWCDELGWLVNLWCEWGGCVWCCWGLSFLWLL